MSAQAGAAQAAVQNIIKASGALIKIDEEEFRKLISRMERGLVIEKPGGSFLSSYKYSTSYQGFVFYCRAKEQITIPTRLEKITARQMWTPQ